MVYVYTYQLLADGLDEKGSGNGGVYTAGQGEENLLVTYLLADGRHLLIDECLGQCRRGDALHVVRTSVVCHSTSLCVGPQKRIIIHSQK